LITRPWPGSGRSDVRREPAQKSPARAHIVDAEHDVRAEIRLRPVAQHRRLDLVEIERGHRSLLADPLEEFVDRLARSSRA